MPGRKFTPKIFVTIGTFYGITGSSEAPIVHNGTLSLYHRVLRCPNSSHGELEPKPQVPPPTTEYVHALYQKRKAWETFSGDTFKT